MVKIKLKTLPEDFRVEEMTDFVCSSGDISLYRLQKRSIGTPEAIEAILRHWNLSRKQVSYGGLKDRHAVTSQYLTLYQGPKQDLEERSFRLEYLGPCRRPFGPTDIRGNRFEIALRGISPSRIDAIEGRIPWLRDGGVVNYFDDQRFGSLGYSGQFIAHPWCMGDYERALYLAMADLNSHDQPREAEQKKILIDHWGDWNYCKQHLDRSHRRSIVTYLCDHPTDFRRAIALIRQDLRSIYLAAFQSFMWNRWVSNVFDNRLPEDCRTVLNSRCGPLSLPTKISAEVAEELANLELPLPSSRQKVWDPRYRPFLEPTLESLQMTVEQIRLKYPRDTFFSKGTRACWFRVRDFEHRIEKDEINPKSMKVLLRFELPRGSYATMIVKQLTQVADSSEFQDN